MDGSLSILDTMLESLIPIALQAEDFMATLTGSHWFYTVYNIFFAVGVSLVVLKFLYKGFNVYIGWMEGDPDADPIGLLVNFVRALAVAIGFPIIYTWVCGIVTTLTDQVLNAIGFSMQMGFMALIAGLATGGLFLTLIMLVFFIMLLVMYIQFLGRGIEMLILRIGVPFACTGLLDSDKGVFGAYVKKFLQTALTVLIQIVLCKLAVGLMLNAHPFWSVATIMVALRTPKMLQEFILPYGGSGMVNTVYHTSRLFQMAKRTLSKSSTGGGGA